MGLSPNPTELLARARADLRMGVPIVMTQGESGVLILAAETASADRLELFRQLGEPVVAITARRAETLKARCYDDGLARLELPGNADVAWVQAIADPENDLKSAMKGPLKSRRGQNAEFSRMAIELTKAARLLPTAVVVDVKDPKSLAGEHALTSLDLDVARSTVSKTSHLQEIVSARVPLKAAQNSRLHVFRPEDGGEEHYAIEIGKPDRNAPVLARLHSACFTGDLLGSLKCDCGPQLRAALEKMGGEGSGILLYLNQEGRGIGLANKMRAYSLQDQGFDTVEANHRLGFEDDERDFRLGAAILSEMGFSSIRLLTNNPKKVEMMQANGIAVTDRVPLAVGHNPHNLDYLKTKAEKSGHIL